VAHVLVIDATPDVRDLLRGALEGEGYSVSEAADAGAALRALQDRPADLVLCDLYVVETESPEAIGALRAGRPGLKVIALNAGSYYGVEPLPTAAALGAAATLDKPFHVADLLDTVAAVLAG
jgi:DNA-binding NtrC family response regulator